MKSKSNSYLLMAFAAALFVLSSCRKENKADFAPKPVDLSSKNTEAALPVTAATFKVIGYMPSWEGDVNTVQYSKLTHINYAFLIPNTDGSLQALDNTSKFTSLVATAHNNGVKVIISVGGGG